MRTGPVAEELSAAQIEILKTATPDELAFVVRFARNYVNGRWIACMFARAIVGIGTVAAAIAGGVELLKAFGVFK